ncbi:metal cation symporter ZIP8-like [Diadema antillarum]|uniref:metal cation symporter ZIP8-like n=1 Tax=Diadema antillarum TaxID=105358 RepID=UPI003A850C46
MATKLFLRLVCTFLLLNVAALAAGVRVERSSHDHDHDHGDEENFVQIGNYLLDEETKAWREEEDFEANHDRNITFEQVRILVQTVFGRLSCESRVANCSTCVNDFTTDVFAALNVDQAHGLSEDAFLHASPLVLYGAHGLVSVCQAGSGGTDLSEDAVENALRSANSEDGNATLSEDDLDAILDTISDDYTAESNSMCFDVETIFDEAVSDHEAGASEEEMLSVCEGVIAGLLQGHCIGEATVPTQEAFVDAVFDDHGSSGVITEEEFEVILTELGIGGISHGHDDHAHRRSVDEVMGGKGRRLSKRATATDDDHDHDHDHGEVSFLVNETCYSAEELLDVYGIDHEAGISEAQFSQLSPSLIQQILSGACAQAASEPSTISNAEIWGYGTLAVAIISAISLLGGAFVPCMSSGFYEKAIQTMIALAVATLTGDAILHLIPQAVGLHAHEAGSEAHSPTSPELAYIWRCLVVQGAIYVFFVFEQFSNFTKLCAHSHSHSIDDSNGQQQPSIEMSGPRESKRSSSFRNGALNKAAARTTESKRELTEYEGGTNGSGDVERGCCKGIHPVAVMVILGDTLHNFGDGLAIGAAFTVSLGAGLSTSIAVLCHELPHELGDLAVLLKQGLKLSTALLLNLLSACTAFIGLWIGIPLTQASAAREWIFAVVAGMFLYVGLVDMLPMLHSYRGKSSKAAVAILQNIGFLVGVGIILVIALYEDAITISI